MGTTLERGALLHKRYRIVEILGQGGMGSVYRAVDENLGMDVAVKENLFTSDEYARQFRLEAVILANLRHTNLPRVTDHFVIGDQGQYLIMDYIEGEDLRQRMERAGSISEEEAILVGAAMCDALEYLHTRKPAVIHRDVKPGNVRITSDGHVYLVDFGLAKLVKGSQATTTGARAMTPGYSPPEQYGTARTDPRTDVYSLGATLYAALTGIIPEDGLSRAMDNVELTPLRKRNPKISRKLANAIEKAMSIRPDDRFQTAEEFKQALATSNVKTQRLEGEIRLEPPPQTVENEETGNLANEVSPAENDPPLPPLPPSRPRKNPGRNNGFWIFLSFFLLAILAGLVSIIIFRTPVSKSLLALLVPPASHTATATTTATAVDAITPPPIVSTDTAIPTVMDAPSPTKTAVPSIFMPSMTPTMTQTLGPIATLQGGGYSQIAFASTRNGDAQIFIVNSNGTNLQQITNITGGACQPDWSPDGLHLVFISPCQVQQPDSPSNYKTARLYIINFDGSGLAKIPTLQTGNFDPAWSPDGHRIAYASLTDGLAQINLINMVDFVVTPLTQVSTDVRFPDWSRQPAWSPDGKKILYTGHSRLTDAPQIWIMSDLGENQTALINRGSANWDFLPNWSPDGKTILFNETNGPQALGWLMLFDDTNPLTTAVHWRSGTQGDHGSFSPDGLWLVFQSLDANCSDCLNDKIYIVRNASGNSPIVLYGGQGQNFDPDWRPIASP
jgi:serine/threonine protein kinase